MGLQLIGFQFWHLASIVITCLLFSLLPDLIECQQRFSIPIQGQPQVQGQFQPPPPQFQGFQQPPPQLSVQQPQQSPFGFGPPPFPAGVFKNESLLPLPVPQPNSNLDILLVTKPMLTQFSTHLFSNPGNLQSSTFSRFSKFHIWYLAAQVLPVVQERGRPDYILFMQPPALLKGVPAENLTQALLTGSSIPNPEVFKALIEQSSGMLISQQSVLVQRLKSRLTEPFILRTILSSENPSELFDFFNPRLLAKNMGGIIKVISDTEAQSRSTTTALSTQVKLLPPLVLGSWLAWVQKSARVQQWTFDDLVGRSFFGAANRVNLALMGFTCREMDIVAAVEILPVLEHYRRDMAELKRVNKDLAFPINLRHCALRKVLEYLRQKNETQGDANILSGLKLAEINAIGGEILTGVSAEALSNIPVDIRQNMIEEIARVEILELINLTPLNKLQWYANTLLQDLQANKTATLANQLVLPSTDSASLQRMGNLICYSNDLVEIDASKSVLREMLQARIYPGEKTCCLSNSMRDKWSAALKDVFGSDTSTWAPVDLNFIGDLLLTLSEDDLNKIPTESLSRSGVHQKASKFGESIKIFGWARPTTFVQACVSALDSEGPAFYASYKRLMRRFLEAAQLVSNSVKTVDEILLSQMAAPIRVQRSAPHTVPRFSRQAIHPSASQIDSQPAPRPSGTPVSMSTTPQRPPTVMIPMQRPGQNPNIGSAKTVAMKTSGAPISAQQRPLVMMPVQQSTQNPGSVPTQAHILSGTSSSMSTMSQRPAMAMPMQQLTQNPNLGSGKAMSTQVMAPISKSMPLLDSKLPSQVLQTQAPPATFKMASASNSMNSNQAINSAPIDPRAKAQQLQQQPGGQQPGGQQPTGPQPGGRQPVGQQPAGPQPGGLQPGGQQPGGQQPGGQQPGGQQPGGQQPGGQQPGGQQPGGQQPGGQQPGGQQPGGQQPGGQQPGGQQPSGQQLRGLPPGGPTLVRVAPGLDSQNQNVTDSTHLPLTGRASTDSINSNQTDDIKTRGLPTGPEISATQVDFTCRGIKAAGSAAIGLTIKDLDRLPPQELFDCVDVLGLVDWEVETKSQILKLLNEKFKLTTSGLTAIVLIELGKLVSAFSVNTVGIGWSAAETSAPNSTENALDISQVNLTLPGSLDILAILGSQINDPLVVKTLAEKFTSVNPLFLGPNIRGPTKPDLLRVVVLSLGNILCGIDRNTLQTVFSSDSTLYIDTSPMLGRLEKCDLDVLSLFAEFAIKATNYGPPNTWTQEDLMAIGVVAAGLSPELIETIPIESMGGMQASAIRSMPLETFQKFTAQQLLKLPYDAAFAVQKQQVDVLTPEQNAALKNATIVQSEDFRVPPEFFVELPQVTDPVNDIREKSINETEEVEPRSVGEGKNEGELVILEINEDPANGTNNSTNNGTIPEEHGAVPEDHGAGAGTATTTTPAPSVDAAAKTPAMEKDVATASASSCRSNFVATVFFVIYLSIYLKN